MSQLIGLGTTWHCRIGKVSHAFNYPVAYLVLDLAQWGQKKSKLFSYDKWNLFSIDNGDYLQKGDAPLLSKVMKELKSHNHENAISKVLIHTSPKFLGFCFNPVNFYYCYEGEKLSIVLVEINNTFGEKHTYCIKIKEGVNTYRVPKSFHVSPFNKIEGVYRFIFQNPNDKYQIHVDIEKAGKPVFLSGIEIEPKPLKTQELLKIALFYPVTLLGTTFRIGVQAFKLYFFKKLEIFDKPKPSSSYTQRWCKPVLLQRILTGEYLEKIQKVTKG
jgi:cyclopropane-fatty-acyl-phospholipid synthase